MKSLGLKHLMILPVAGLLVACASKKVVTTDAREPANSAELIDPSMANTAQLNNPGFYVLDGGRFDEHRDDSGILTMGGKAGWTIEEEKFVSLDREKYAPVGKVLYVMTDENPGHCVKARFATFKSKKVLLAYPKSPVPSDYCVYQKAYTDEGRGFTVVLSENPSCQPSYSTVKIDEQKRHLASVEPIKRPVSFSYCVDSTVSYGETHASRNH